MGLRSLAVAFNLCLLFFSESRAGIKLAEKSPEEKVVQNFVEAVRTLRDSLETCRIERARAGEFEKHMAEMLMEWNAVEEARKSQKPPPPPGADYLSACRSYRGLDELHRSLSPLFRVLTGVSPGRKDFPDYASFEPEVRKVYKAARAGLAEISARGWTDKDIAKLLAKPLEDKACPGVWARNAAVSSSVKRPAAEKISTETGSAAGLTDSTTAGDLFDGQTPRTGLLSDTGVRRRRVLLQYDGTIMDDEAFTGVVTALSPDTQVVVLVSPYRQDDLTKLLASLQKEGRGPLKERGGNIRVAPGHGSLSVWSRDYFLAMLDQAGPKDSFEIIRPKDAPRYTPEGGGDPFPLQKALQSHCPSEYRFTQSQLQFEGGMIVSSGDTAFVSTAFRARNPWLAGQVSCVVEVLLGVRRVVEVPYLKQPTWPHIDLYVTPVGGKRVLVADTRWGAQLVSDWLGSEPPLSNPRAARLAALCGNYSAGINAVFDAAGKKYDFPDIRPNDEHLDAIAGMLGKLGFEVRRIPSLLADYPRAFTYNNVFQSGKTVMIPEFGIPPLDLQAERVFRGQGFEPRRVKAEALACNGGVLHCSIHELAIPEKGQGIPDTIRRPREDFSKPL